MFKKSKTLALAAAAAFVVLTGCATTRNTQGDIDTLNARIATLEGQLSEKDAEIARLQNQMKGEENARVEAENQKRALAEKLQAARSATAAVKVSKPTVVDSDLK